MSKTAFLRKLEDNHDLISIRQSDSEIGRIGKVKLSVVNENVFICEICGQEGACK